MHAGEAQGAEEDRRMIPQLLAMLRTLMPWADAREDDGTAGMSQDAGEPRHDGENHGAEGSSHANGV